MTSSIKSFGSGVSESFNLLADNAPVIALGIAVGGGIGFLIGGYPAAWLAAKTTALALGLIYAIGNPKCVIQPNILSPENCHSIGSIAASAGIPYFLIHCIQILVGAARI